ncbi:unnamed protein product, partial [Callosobruchus maculatus]
MNEVTVNNIKKPYISMASLGEMKSSKVLICSLCEVPVHTECANYDDGSVSAYKCEKCSMNSSDTSIETVIDKHASGESYNTQRNTFPEVVCEELIPKHPESYVSFKVFCEKLDQIFKENFDSSTNFILCGDSNVDPIRDKNNYEALLNILERIFFNKRLYYENKIINSKNVTKGAWNVVQMISNKESKKTSHFKIRDNNLVIRGTDLLADRFNQHFVDIPKNIV